MNHRRPRSIPSRRNFLRRTGAGSGLLARADLLARDGPAGDVPRAVPGSARSVIPLVMDGGPSQVDTSDPKPELTRREGQALPTGERPEGASPRWSNVPRRRAVDLGGGRGR